jgi:hypothetical protein
MININFIITLIFYALLMFVSGLGTNGPNVPSTSCNDLPKIELFIDLNADNRVTIDDASIGLKRAALSPGDKFITLICDNDISNYFEIDSSDFGGVFSGAISLLQLLLIFYTLTACVAFISTTWSLSSQLKHKNYVLKYLLKTWNIVAFFFIPIMYLSILNKTSYLEYVPFPIGFLINVILFSFAHRLGVKIFIKKESKNNSKVDETTEETYFDVNEFKFKPVKFTPGDVVVEMFLNFKSNTILVLSLLLLFMLSPFLSLAVSLFWVYHTVYTLFSEREKVVNCLGSNTDVITQEGVDVTLLLSGLVISSLGAIVSIAGFL